MANDDLAVLLEGARRRAPEALAELCERFYPQVLKYMYYRVGANVAEDLTEEVFLRVVRFIEGQRGAFKGWLYRVAGNVVADWFRRGKCRQPAQLDEETLAGRSRGADPAETVALRLDLAQAMAQLTDDQRELVTLKFIQGFSNVEIGEITGRTPEAIRSLQARALSALRQILSSEVQNDD